MSDMSSRASTGETGSERATVTPRRLLVVLQSTALGGMETHTIDIAREFARRGTKVRVILPEFDATEELRERFHSAGILQVEVITTDARRGRLYQVRDMLRFVKVLRSFRPNVVHLHTGGATGGSGIIAASRALSRATVVITEHDVPSEARLTRDRLGRRAIDFISHGVIAVSRRNANLRERRAGAPNAFYAVYNGIAMPTFVNGERSRVRSELRQEFGIAEDAVVLGTLVRLAEGKGMDTLLRAYAEAKRPTNSTLLVVGDGPLRSKLEALADELGIAAECTWTGHRRDGQRTLTAMDAFCLAVPAGSMSIALLEAMAAGLPSVITFWGPEEAIVPGQTGLVARPNDPSSLASQLELLLNDAELRERLGTAAEAHIRAKYSAERLADDLTRIYQSQVNGWPADLLARRPLMRVGAQDRETLS